MSSEKPEVQSQTLPHAEDITQQATSPAPKTHVKNPNRVAAGKMVAARTKKNKEEQKKKAEDEAELANKNEKSVASPSEEESGLSVNQWIGILGLLVSVAGLFVKREEIMATVKKNLPSPPTPPVEPAPPPPPVEPAPQRKVLRKMT